MTETDWAWIAFLSLVVIFVVGSLWRYFKGEYEYRKWVKENDMRRE